MANPEDTLTAEDHRIITASVAALQVGRELKEWWQKTDASGAYEGRYEESTVPYRPMDTSFGFSGEVNFSTGKRPVIGNVQEMFYDRPKAPKSSKREAIEWTRVQLREFVLKYFMRVASYQQPQAVPEPVKPDLPSFLKWLTDDDDGSTRKLRRGWFQRHEIAWPEGVTEFQLPYGDWIRLFRRNGFEVVDLVHLRAPKGGETTR